MNVKKDDVVILSDGRMATIIDCIKDGFIVEIEDFDTDKESGKSIHVPKEDIKKVIMTTYYGGKDTNSRYERFLKRKEYMRNGGKIPCPICKQGFWTIEHEEIFRCNYCGRGIVS